MEEEPAETQNFASSRMCFLLQRLKEKELKINLHVTYLSDYGRKSMIPRGLRRTSFPSLHDDEFREKWEAILNECSSDLRLLLREESKKQKTALEIQTKDVTVQLREKIPEQERLLFEKKLTEDKEKLSVKLKERKKISKVQT